MEPPNRLVHFAFIAVALVGCFDIAWAQVHASAPVVLAIGVLIAATSVLGSRRPARWGPRVQSLAVGDAGKAGSLWGGWLWIAIGLGVSLRLVWISLVSPVQTSDATEYFAFAEGLLDSGSYRVIYGNVVLRASRPPGYPFVLASLMHVFGTQSWIPAGINVAAFVASCIGVWAIARQLFSKRTAVTAVLLLALWPSDVMVTGLAFSDPLCAALLVTAAWALVRSSGSGWGLALAGLLLGYGALVRPPLLLVGLLWAAMIALEAVRLRKGWNRAPVLLLCMALVIAPWTLRNYIVLGGVVLVSSNGGDIFYRANNPRATGSWTLRGEQDLRRIAANELEWNKKGYEWGKDWIRRHPVAFAKLALRKQAILLGEDDTGAYWAIARGHLQTGAFHAVARHVSNVWWLFCWMLMVSGVIRGATAFSEDARASLLLLAVLTLVAVHSVYESQPRYHIVFVPFLTVLAGLAVDPKAHRPPVLWGACREPAPRSTEPASPPQSRMAAQPA